MPLINKLKQYCLHGIALFCALILTGCSCCSVSTISPSEEDWLCHMNLSLKQWLRCADSWFLTGEPNCIERRDMKAPIDKAMTIMTIRVGDFVNIVSNGSYQIQIEGNQDENSVQILGPHASARQVVVNLTHNTLYLSQPKDCTTINEKTIIRIGIRNLRSITNLGCGNIYGRYVLSDCLKVNAFANGSIYLMGKMNLTQVFQRGSGTITVLGVNAPALDINVVGNGNVNISGRAGVQAIKHYGDGNVGIIGLDSDSLVISTSGAGSTAAAGSANLKSVSAIGDSQVYLYWVNSNHLEVFEGGRARVGLAGTVRDLTIKTKDKARFEGQYLRSGNAFVKTEDSSHVNVNAADKLFVASVNNSSVYSFGKPANVSHFSGGRTTFVPLPFAKSSCPVQPPPIAIPMGCFNPEYRTGGRAYFHSND